LYPPTDVPSLLHLLQAIENSNYDTLKKDCLVYFLLKWHQDGRETQFADERCIPPQFSALSDAYWHLDTGLNVPLAVSILSDARLNRDYASKILKVISLAQNPTPLILRYVRTAKPLLTEPEDIDKYAMALAETSFTEAWQYQRTFSEDSETRTRILRKVIHWCLSPTPRAQPLKQLLAHPISAYEQSTLHSYALNPPRNLPSASIPVIHDLVCVRLINSGQYTAAIKLDRQLTITGSRATEKSQKASQDRRQMMDEILAVMPSVERQILEVELSDLAQGKDLASLSASTSGLTESWANAGHGAINDLSMSWEHVRPKVSTALPRTGPFANISSLPIPERAGAPRFGGGSALSRSGSDASFAANGVSTKFPPPATNNPPVPPMSVSVSTPVEPSVPPRKPGFRLGQNSAPESGPGFNSANQTPNAFYNPPSISAGLKRSFGQDEPMEVPIVGSDHEVDDVEDEDVEMQSEDDPENPPATKTSRIGDDEPPSQFSFSVFGTSSNGANKSDPPAAEAKPKMPPGAFGAESDEEQDAEPAFNVRLSVSASPPPSRALSPPPHPKLVKKPVSVKGKEKNTFPQTIPGSLFEDEEEDVVAPLPSPRKPARKSRVAPKPDLQEESPQKPTRRSSRLSTASSRGSPSPEPVSPQKPKARKSTRSAAGTAPTTRASGRKKRS